ncbi:MAG: hypothetical protein ABI857_12595 [Acidobacteriota bacterium]
MLQFYAHNFAELFGYFQNLANHVDSVRDHEIEDRHKDIIVDSVGEILKLCEQMELSFAIAHVSRNAQMFTEKSFSFKQLTVFSSELTSRIYDEFETWAFFALDSKNANLYKNIFPFGEAVADGFPSTVFDIDEAAKCLALGRDTASVFHVARAVEGSLKALATRLGVIGYDNSSWDSILKKIDGELTKKYQDKEPEWRVNEDFYADAASHLRSYKNSRNRTSHADKKYTPDEADRIFNAGKLLMQHLTTKLSEADGE